MTADSLHLVVRWVHVGSATAIAGGALLVWMLAARPLASRAEADALLLTAERYEWAFWSAAGLIVATGVGNLAAFGGALPGGETAWGETLLWKLAAVFLLLAVSLVRSLVLARMLGGTVAALGVVRFAYGATMLVAALIVALAVWLAHG